MVVYDPVSGKEVDPENAYACVDGLYFSSMQTQQVYYQSLLKGFQVKVVSGRPQLVQVPGTRVWTLNKPEGFVSRSKGHYEMKSLTAGDYVFVAESPDLLEHKGKSVTVKVKAVTAGGSVLLDTSSDLTSTSIRVEFKFSVTREQSPCVTQVDFTAHSTFKRIRVVAHLEMTPIPKLRQDILNARRLSKQMQEPGEQLVELNKGASGAGMTLTWDAERQGVVVHRVKESGAAARAKIKPGDMIMAIQGQRVKGYKLKQVIRMLRNVPATVVLLMTDAPDGYVAKATTGQVKKIEGKQSRKKRAPPPPPPGTNMPPTTSSRPGATIPPARHGRSATTGGALAGQPMLQQPPSRRPPSMAIPQPGVPPRRPERRSLPHHGATPVVAKTLGGRAAPQIPERRSVTVRPPVPKRRTAPPPPPGSGNNVRHSMPVNPSTASALGARAQLAAKASAQRMSGKFESPVEEQPTAAAPPPPPRRSMAPTPSSVVPDIPTRNQAPAAPSSSDKVAPPPLPTRSAAPPPPPVAAAQEHPVTSTPPQSQQSFGEEYAKYAKMLKSGVPEGAVRVAFQRDGVTPPAGFFAEDVPQQSSMVPPPRNSAPPPNRPSLGGFLGEIQGGAAGKLRKAEPAPTPASATAASSSNPMLAALQGFNKEKLRKTSEVEKPEPRSSVSSNPLLSGLANFDKSRLRSSSTPAKQSETEQAAVAAALAEKGKSGLHSAFASAIEQRRGFIADSESESDEEYNDDDEWEL